MTNELKPCPFCGETGVSFREGSTFRWLVIECDECGATPGEVRVQTTGNGTPEEWRKTSEVNAIAAWNRRPSPPAGDEREAFERWINETGYEIDPPEGYADRILNMGWQAWQARASIVPSAGEAAEQAVIQSPVFEYQKARTLPTELTSTKSPAPQPAMRPDPHDDNPHAGQCCNVASRKAFGDCPYCGRKAK